MASFDITQFRGQMTGDGARPNLFACEIPGIPSAAQGGGAGDSGQANGSLAATKFNFMCRAAQLPGSTVNAVPVNYFGRELKFAGNRTFTEWTVTVINDEDFIVRNSIERWMDFINSHRRNIRASNYVSPVEYQKDAFVTQYGKAGPERVGGSEIKKYKFIGMFPIDLSPIELDWGANDTIEEFAVTFAYQWWEAQPDNNGGTTT